MAKNVPAGNNVSIRIRLDPRATQALLADTRNASVFRAAQVTRDRMKTNITRTGRVDTGLMRDSVTASRPRNDGHSVTSSSVSITGKAGKYAAFQEHGTRAHGPVHAKFLRFKPKGSNTFVYAKHVRGVRAAHFARDAFRDLTLRDYLPK